MKVSFRRITSSGKFIPEIDGLRFVAIISVMFFHFSLFVVNKDFHNYVDVIDYSYLKNIISHGDLGVPLFFIISGFILGLPFARIYLKKSDPVNLKSYFLRRLTRLEPPYVLVMSLLFIGAVFVVKNIGMFDAFLSLIASLTYTHNFFYPDQYPLLNVVAWSLEVEVQFYILAPVIAVLFSIKSIVNKRLVMIGLIIFFIVFNQYYHLPFISLINYIQYFLLGFLLLDIFISEKLLLPKTKYDSVVCFGFFLLIWLFQSEDFNTTYSKILWEIVQIISIFFFYYYVLIHKTFDFFRNPIITNIGGMCYSIYLIHYAVISAFGNVLFSYQFSNYSFVNVFIYTITLFLVIILISGVFFLLVEKPCMNKNWIKDLTNQFKIIKKQI